MSNISSGGQLTKWSNELATGTTVNLTKLTSDAIADFLRSAGQIQLLEQVEQVETGFRISLDKMKASLNLGLQLLGHCSTMASMYPQGMYYGFIFISSMSNSYFVFQKIQFLKSNLEFETIFLCFNRKRIKN